jgi:hypothetical protein
MNEVWSQARFESATDVVRDYLLPGERAVKDLEDILATAAPRAYAELLTTPSNERNVRHFLETQRPSAAVIFDGLSLREIPALLKLAQNSGLKVKEIGVSLAAIPSETLDFTEQRLKLSGRVAPSALPGRGELRAVGVECYYFDSPRDRRVLNTSAPALLLWSSFPDQTYGDAEAKFDRHFAGLQALLETAWQNTVQQIPPDRSILVTSDHGYIFLGAGLFNTRSDSELRQLFGGERFARLEPNDPRPDHPDVAVVTDRDVALLRGRVKVPTTGADAAKLYKHGGLSLMEMLTPWLVMQPR